MIGTCPHCSAPPGATCRGAAQLHEARISTELRRIARRLSHRFGSPSLDGYELVNGLRAAADLIDGLSGPEVHPDCRPGSDEFPPHVTLAQYAAQGPSSNGGQIR